MKDFGLERRADNLMLTDEIKPGIFSKIGKTLSEIHTKSLYDKKVKKKFDNSDFHEIKIKYRYYKYKQVKDPSLEKTKKDLIRKTRKNNITFLHHDLKMNNLFIIGNNFFLIDYEGAYYGDPAIEIGLFLGHLFLYYFNQPNKKNKKIITNFWKNYITNLGFKFKEKLEYNIVKHTGFSMIYKLFGIAKQDFSFIDNHSKDKITKIAKKIIGNSNIRKINQIFEIN